MRESASLKGACWAKALQAALIVLLSLGIILLPGCGSSQQATNSYGSANEEALSAVHIEEMHNGARLHVKAYINSNSASVSTYSFLLVIDDAFGKEFYKSYTVNNSQSSPVSEWVRLPSDAGTISSCKAFVFAYAADGETWGNPQADENEAMANGVEVSVIDATLR